MKRATPRFLLAIAVLASSGALAGGAGSNWSVNQVLDPAAVLLATIPSRIGRENIEIQAGCSAGVFVVLDGSTGEVGGTIYRVDGTQAVNMAGGEYETPHHTGRVRVYSTDAVCPVAIREWP